MAFESRFLPDIAICAAGIWASRRLFSRRLLVLAFALPIALGLAAGLRGLLFAVPPAGLALLWSGVAITLSGCLLLTLGVSWVRGRLLERLDPAASPARRQALQALGGAAVAAPAAIAAFGILSERRRFELVTQRLRFPGLPPDLQGTRIVQLTDIHLSPFLSRADLAYCVGLANDARPHLACVTGDLVTGSTDPLDDCLAELGQLRASDGVWGCLGNHERYIGAEAEAARRGLAHGIRLLRREGVTLRLGSADMRIVGVDYEPMRKRPYLRGADALRGASGFHLLLSHNPDTFRDAPAQGWDLMLAGHTHGGQVAVEILDQRIAPVRMATPYVQGHYRSGASQLYVSRGIGTVGAPLRLGAPPEVTLLILEAA